jgi:hypothetical protein
MFICGLRLLKPFFVLPILLLGVLALAGAAGAAAPVYPATFSGPSAGGKYNVELDTGCNQGSNSTDCDVSSSYFSIVVTTSKASGKCPGNSQFNFSTPTLKKDGSFSATQAYAGGQTMTVSGRFTTPRLAHGTVSGTQGCSASAFTIKLPAPAVPVAPTGSNACYWLDKAHATQILGGAAKPVGVGSQSYSVLTGLGQCFEWTKKRSSTYYGARTYSITFSTDPPDTTRGFPKKVSGLGPGALSVPDYYSNTVYFKSGSAWVRLSFSIPSASKPAASAVTAQGKQLLVVAHRIYAQIH